MTLRSCTLMHALQMILFLKQLHFHRISVSCVFWYEVNVCLVIYRLSFMTAELCLSTVMLGHISLIQF